MKPYVVSQRVLGRTLFVKYSNGFVKTYDAIELGCKWFKMSNDDRHRSDMISKWLYGCGNISHYNAMLESIKKCNTKEK